MINRRTFLKATGVTIATTAIKTTERVVTGAGAGLLALVNRANAQDRWDFLKANVIAEKGDSDWMLVDDSHYAFKYVQFGGKREIRKGTNEFDNAQQIGLPKVKGEIASRKFSLDDYLINYIQDNFLIPEETWIAEQYLEYCKKAVDFMYEQIPELKSLKHDFKWHIIKEGENFTKNYENTIFIGNSHYFVFIITAINKKDENQSFVYGKTIHRAGGVVRIIYDSKTQTDCLFLGTGGLSEGSQILAPFSEIIPQLIKEVTSKRIDAVGYKRAIEEVEALSEGISYHLGHTICEQLQIPGGHEGIDNFYSQMRQSMKPDSRYKFVPNSIEWMRRQGTDGIRKALELYIESPQTFLWTIQN